MFMCTVFVCVYICTYIGHTYIDKHRLETLGGTEAIEPILTCLTKQWAKISGPIRFHWFTPMTLVTSSPIPFSLQAEFQKIMDPSLQTVDQPWLLINQCMIVPWMSAIHGVCFCFWQVIWNTAMMDAWLIFFSQCPQKLKYSPNQWYVRCTASAWSP